MPRIGPQNNPAMDHALAWAEQGWPVFPLKPNSKIPLFPSPHPKGTKCDGRCGQTGHGVLDATRDPDKIRQMFEGHAGANIGGATTGRVVIDLDYQHGGERADALPPTRTHLSGRGNGNEHLIYRAAGPVSQRLSQGKLADGVDLKSGSSAYVVLPPSLHPDTGQPYTVADEADDEHPLTDDELAAVWTAYGKPLPGQRRETPAAATEPLSRDTTEPLGLLGRSEAVQFILNPPERGQGRTNDALSKVCGYYARQYREQRALYEHHVRAWLAQVDPNYEDADKTIESVWETEHSKEGERAFAVAQRVEAKLVEHEAKILFGKALAELEPAAPLDIGTLGEVLARPHQEQYRVGGLVLMDGFTSVVAMRKTGKTTFNLNLADSLLTGRDFLGRFPVTPVDGTVAILNYEVSGHQLALWADKVGIDRTRLLLVNLRGRRNPLSHDQDRAELAAKLRDHGVESLLVDPFSRAFYGDNANDNTQVQAFLNDLDVFARSEVGARDVVLNVHSGWGGDRSRGASALEDHPDSIVWLRKNNDDGDNGPRFLSALGRDVDVDEDQLLFDPTTQRLSLTGLGSRHQAKREQKRSDLEPEILRLVTANPGINSGGVTAGLKERGNSFQKGAENDALKAMRAAGRIGWKRGANNASLWYPAGHPDAVTTVPLAGTGEEEF